MTHRTVYRRDYDAANLRRRASFARADMPPHACCSYCGTDMGEMIGNETTETRFWCGECKRGGGKCWLEVYHQGQRKPSLQDLTGDPPDSIARTCRALDELGIAWAFGVGKHLPDREGRE